MPLDQCVSCGQAMSTPFCAACGEKRASDRKHTLTEFAAESVEALTSFDSRAIRTYRVLLTRPGGLTLEFIRGVRLRYLSPLQCFLIINVLFFLWSTATDHRVLDADLHLHVSNGLYGRVAKRIVAEKVAQEHGDSLRVAQQFSTVTGAQAKSLVLVMVPLFAIGVAVLTAGRPKRYAVHHVVFSLHFYSYLLVLFVVVFSVLVLLATTLPHSVEVLLFAGNQDDVLSAAMVIGIAAYLWIALRRVYDLGGVRAGVTAVAAAFFAFAVLMAYRALLFFTTMASM